MIDLADQGLIRTVLDAGNHLLSLSAYLRGLPVIPDDRFDPVQSAQIRAAELFLADRSAWSDARWFGPIDVPGLIGLRAISAPRPFRNLVLLEGEAPVACIRNGLPFVSPDHRGRGLGALLVLISDITGGRYLCPVSYSEAGWRARRSAHALQVRIAHQATWGQAEKETGAEAPVLSV
jgi:GNAT superfamily N-acetyltransferase